MIRAMLIGLTAAAAAFAEPARAQAGALDCPQKQGALRLSGRAEGACTYAGADGAVVTLRRRSGPPEAALDALKAELRPLITRRTKGRSRAGGDDPVIVDSRSDTIDIRSSGDGGAEIDIRNDAPGQLRATFILAGDEPGPGGWRLAGYEARGPRRGPLTIATVRSRGAAGRQSVFDDMRELVKSNTRAHP